MKRKASNTLQANNNKSFKFNVEKIETLDDLINLGIAYNNFIDTSKHVKSNRNINLEKLGKIVSSLVKLNNMIGMTDVKKTVIDHVLYFIQDLQDTNEDLLHIVIQGPPGTGKTELGRILGEIYFNLGIIKKPKPKQPQRKSLRMLLLNEDSDDDTNENELDKPVDKNSTKSSESDKIEEPKMIFKVVSRADLIAGYLGQTALKTQKVIDSCLGGILFIDEAYSLGSDRSSDSYAKECIDTLNLNLTEKKNQLLCIIAGYKDELQKCFFSYNPGLERRFPFIYQIEKYDYRELFDIFKCKLSTDSNWALDDSVTESFFKKNINYFPNYGGDIEVFLFSCKIKHARRLFQLLNDNTKKDIAKKTKVLNIQDLEEGIKLLTERKEDSTENYKTMFI